jgi:hypothetical protein
MNKSTSLLFVRALLIVRLPLYVFAQNATIPLTSPDMKDLPLGSHSTTDTVAS